MRRTLGTDMQGYGSLKDAQMVLRHSSITTTGNVYVQEIAESTMKAINARTKAVLSMRTEPILDVKQIGKPLGREEENADTNSAKMQTRSAMGSNGLQFENSNLVRVTNALTNPAEIAIVG